jgi:hypothetical protein
MFVRQKNMAAIVKIVSITIGWTAIRISLRHLA